MDRLAPALAAMEGGPAIAELLPVRVESGSAQPVLRMRRDALPAVARFRGGPKRTWTVEQRVKVGRVYDFLAQRNATLRCGIRTLKPVVVPAARPPWRVRELTTLRGEVRRAGGVAGRVEIGFDEYGHLHCDAGRKLAKELAEHLYERVAVTGEAVMDANTQALVQFRILSFEVLVQTPLQQGIRELRDLLEDDLVDFDPGAFLEEIRR